MSKLINNNNDKMIKERTNVIISSRQKLAYEVYNTMLLLIGM